MKPWKQIDEKYESLSQKRRPKKESPLESRVRRPTADLKILVYTNGGGKKLDILHITVVIFCRSSVRPKIRLLLKEIIQNMNSYGLT